MTNRTPRFAGMAPLLPPVRWARATGAAQCVRQWYACPRPLVHHFSARYPPHVAREQNGTLHPPLVPFAQMLRRLASEESAELGERRLTARPESHLASDRLKYLTL